ncbi:MAG TPA: glycosyltransferase family 39 protein, partial [Candidatus Binatia bacterium]|nr:glycosyltransferase family 39 protein [Candidatus Binatia bacterium]
DLWSDFLNTPHAPLYCIIMFPWTRIFGEHELAVRIPSLLFGISSIVLTFWIGRAYGSLIMAFLAALLLCFSPAHVWYSQEATPYAMTLFFLLATVFAWLRLREVPSHRAWYSVYLSMLLAAVFTHYYAAVFLLPLTLLSVAAEGTLRRRLMVAHGVVVSCLALALGTKYLVGQFETGVGFLRPFTFFEWWMLFFNWFVHGNSLWTVNPYRANTKYLLSEPLLLVCQLFFVIIFIRGLLPDRVRKSWTQTWELLLFVSTLPLCMLVLTEAGYRHLYIERYLLVVLPFFLIVVARGATGLSNVRAVMACSIGLVVIGAASYGAFVYKSDTWTVYKQNPDWRSASRYLNGQSGLPEKAVIVAFTLADDLVYYLRREAKGPHPKVTLYDAEGFERMLSVDGVRAFYLIHNRYWGGAFNEVFQRLKDDKRFSLVNSRSFKGLDVYTFRLQ